MLFQFHIIHRTMKKGGDCFSHAAIEDDSGPTLLSTQGTPDCA